MIKYPVSFFGKSTATPGLKTEWEAWASEYKAICSVPKEFEGKGEAFSPEDFFLMSLINCFVATFKVYSEFSKLSFENLSVRGELIVDKNENLKPTMKKLVLKIEMAKASDTKKAQLLIKKTLENGFILQSVKTEIASEVMFKD